MGVPEILILAVAAIGMTLFVLLMYVGDYRAEKQRREEADADRARLRELVREHQRVDSIRGQTVDRLIRETVRSERRRLER
ncbi:MAG TPA: hypothetical protein VF587_10620 [Solirubrobacteraceae bacterium]|jgi:hypothetical protein